MSASILSGVVTTPYVAFETSLSGTTVDLVSANDIATYPFNLPYTMQISEIGMFIGLGDASNKSDIGLYDTNGNLLADIGAQYISAANADSFSLSNGPIVIGPGTYIFAITSAGTTLRWAASNPTYSLAMFTTTNTSSGGALPSSITYASGFDEGNNSPYAGFMPVMILM